MRFALIGVLAAALAAATAPPRPVLIDTDCGTDDLLAISFLLSRPDVAIEAITVTSGLAHVHEGAMNILRLLDLAGRRDIPVYEGRAESLPGGNEFPRAWRISADNLPGVKLPATGRKPEGQSAVDFLAARFTRSDKPVSILALGPLTNLAEAFQRSPKAAAAVVDMVIMGGAVRVPGNVGDAGFFPNENRTSEWNFYADPSAARSVFRSGVRFRLVPLDATNAVPIDLAFLRELKASAKSPLAKLAAALVESSGPLIQDHNFYAWDPLAAVALVDASVVKISFLPLDIVLEQNQEGRTVEQPGGSGVRVALDADAAAFRKVFLAALNRPERQ